MEKVKTTRSNTTSHMVILVAATATCYTLHSSIYVRRRDHVELHLMLTHLNGVGIILPWILTGAL